MFIIMLNLIKTRTGNSINAKRNFWHYIHLAFNHLDEERRKQFGPDRTCAEWLLRNGAKLMWVNSTEYLADYNALPPEEEKKEYHIEVIDASDSSISHYGFSHLVGCNCIKKIILRKCMNIENKALLLLEPVKNSLRYLEISQCGNVTDKGLNSLVCLTNLHTLMIDDLPYVKDKRAILKNLKEHLPDCNINFR